MYWTSCPAHKWVEVFVGREQEAEVQSQAFCLCFDELSMLETLPGILYLDNLPKGVMLLFAMLKM